MHCKWADDTRLPSLNCLIWKSFKRFPTTLEWARFRGYARRVRGLKGYGTLNILSPEVSLVLQLCATNEPLFPHLKTLELHGTIGEFTPLIPSLLSPNTTVIDISFCSCDLPEAVIASVVITFPRLCPNLRKITLDDLPRDLMITTAVSGLLLASNRDTLRSFHVDSPLTEEAREVIYRLPDLRELSVVIEGDTSFPSVVLPNLVNLTITYDRGSDWLRAFRGATFGKLEVVTFQPESERIGDFIEAFEQVALATSAHNTLSGFRLYTKYPWNPNCYSLLPFTRLTDLVIEFSCDGGCSSRVDDDIVINLARTMPKLEGLQLGGPPCREIPTGVTVKGLVALANQCPDLLDLRIHFEVASLSTPPAIPRTTSDARSTAPRGDCALTCLEVGKIPVTSESVTVVAVTLGRIFPHMEAIDYFDENWEKVVDAICVSREIIDC